MKTGIIKHKWAAMEGIVFKSFKIKAILEHLKWEMIVDTDAGMEKLDKLNEIAKERCPGYYCVTHEIFPEIKIIKK